MCNSSRDCMKSYRSTQALLLHAGCNNSNSNSTIAVVHAMHSSRDVSYIVVLLPYN